MTGPDRWRLFVAVPIGDDVRAALAAAVEGWREWPDLEGLRWTDPAAWHVTLHFLGAVEASRVRSITDALADVATGHERMRLGTGGLGGFPSAGRARVAWYGVADPERRLPRLAADVHAALAPEDAADGRFRAHITLARARVEPVDLRGWMGGARAPEGRLEVGEIHLMRSHLGRGPARYETIASVRVGARVHA